MNVYVLEVNPRASRTVPFVAKATGVPVAKIAAKVMAGMTLAELGIDREPIPVARFDQGKRVSVPQVRRRRYRARPRDAEHGRSDGHQRAVLDRLCQEPAGGRRRLLPEAGDGKIFLSVSARHKDTMAGLARRLVGPGFRADRHRRHGRAAGAKTASRSSESRSSPKDIPT